jgi:hypothetical protein
MQVCLQIHIVVPDFVTVLRLVVREHSNVAHESDRFRSSKGSQIFAGNIKLINCQSANF